MLQLNKTDLDGLVKDLAVIKELSNQIDSKLSLEINQMTPQLEADNFGTEEYSKKEKLKKLIGMMDMLDRLKEVSEALIDSIKMLTNKN